ncbi:MAG TPA: hypothetical protein VK081_07645, partial [Planctomycetota bacterium]|nr:hypothetical protein [Planctomycetota bacterium]
ASPFGILHLAGNVAEMLSSPGGHASAAGGDWLSAPEQVRCDAVETLAGLDVPGRRVGLRIARFVYPTRAADAAAAAACNDRMATLWREGGRVVLDDWEVDDGGNVRKRLRLATILAVPGQVDLDLSTPGFLQADLAVRCADEEIAVHRSLAAHGETSRLVVPTGSLTKGQLGRVEVDAALVPTAGLLGQGDCYVLRVPLKATGTMPALTRVTLPRGSRVDRVDPPPTTTFHQGERPVLVWEFGADRLGERAFAGVIRFRKDGFLTRHWPTRAAAMAVVEDLFAALADPDAERLRALLAPTFVLVPGNLRTVDLLDSARARHARFAAVRFVDVTAVGDVTTAELVVDGTVADGAGVRTLVDWPLRVHWQRQGDRPVVLQVATAGRDDTGRMHDGAYVHDELMVEVAPDPSFTLARTVGQLADMQVELQPARARASGSVCFVTLLGAFQDADPAEDKVWQHLSGGALASGGGSKLLARRAATLGEHAADCEDWEFTAGGTAARERWWKVRAGRRWILVRAVALAATAAEADAAWRASAEWFTNALARVRVR